MEKEKENQAIENDENLNPDDFGENEPKKDDDKSDKGENEQKEPASEESQPDEEEKKRRAEFAKRRREKEAAEKAQREREEREAQIRKEAAEKEALGLISKNPYTGKPIKDAKDIEIYKIQKAIDDRGGDPIADLAEEIAEMNRKEEAERKKAEEDVNKQSDSFREQIAELRKAHPEVNTKNLADDPDFMALADEKHGRWTLLEVYEENERRKAQKKNPEDEKKAKELAGKQKQPSSSGSGAHKQSDDLSKIKSLDEYNDYWKQKYHQ